MATSPSRPSAIRSFACAFSLALRDSFSVSGAEFESDGRGKAKRRKQGNRRATQSRIDSRGRGRALEELASVVVTATGSCRLHRSRTSSTAGRKSSREGGKKGEQEAHEARDVHVRQEVFREPGDEHISAALRALPFVLLDEDEELAADEDEDDKTVAMDWRTSGAARRRDSSQRSPTAQRGQDVSRAPRPPRTPYAAPPSLSAPRSNPHPTDRRPPLPCAPAPPSAPLVPPASCPRDLRMRRAGGEGLDVRVMARMRCDRSGTTRRAQGGVERAQRTTRRSRGSGRDRRGQLSWYPVIASWGSSVLSSMRGIAATIVRDIEQNNKLD
ncbi:hypothetical protein C8R45DRAFT_1069625 [Mycena sanguinolenta]|nr:hypothetical protein C8R45DRAFT_1069625 [Mycena sanguinolenta]